MHGLCTKNISVTDACAKGRVTPSDYAVYVSGLPKNATKDEILNHFEFLYALIRMTGTSKAGAAVVPPQEEAKAPEDIEVPPKIAYDENGKK